MKIYIILYWYFLLFWKKTYKLQMMNFHYLDELLSIKIDVAFYFKIISDTPDCFHTEK